MEDQDRTRRVDKDTGRGIYFRIRQGGVNLTTEEKHLISICRAILKRNKVIIMEEPKNLEAVVEEKIHKLVEHEFKGSTVITIAHRASTIVKSDKVLVLDEGIVAEYDAPQVLLKDEQSMLVELLREMREKNK